MGTYLGDTGTNLKDLLMPNIEIIKAIKWIIIFEPIAIEYNL